MQAFSPNYKMNSKKRPKITKASLIEDEIVLVVNENQEKVFPVDHLKKFSIRKVRSSKLVYWISLGILPLAFLDIKFLLLFILPAAWFLLSKKYFKNYKLILINTRGVKYSFTFGQSIRAQVFNMRVYVKYRMQT